MNGWYLNDDGRLRLAWKTEADLQAGIAEYAQAAGLMVCRELDLTDWGRVDLVVENSTTCAVIELKREIITPSQARKAFAQLDGYGRVIDTLGIGRPYHLFLSAPKIAADVCGTAASAYPWVNLVTFSGLLDRINAMVDDDALKDMDRQRAVRQAMTKAVIAAAVNRQVATDA